MKKRDEFEDLIGGDDLLLDGESLDDLLGTDELNEQPTQSSMGMQFNIVSSQNIGQNQQFDLRQTQPLQQSHQTFFGSTGNVNNFQMTEISQPDQPQVMSVPFQIDSQGSQQIGGNSSTFFGDGQNELLQKQQPKESRVEQPIQPQPDQRNLYSHGGEQVENEVEEMPPVEESPFDSHPVESKVDEEMEGEEDDDDDDGSIDLEQLDIPPGVRNMLKFASQDMIKQMLEDFGIEIPKKEAKGKVPETEAVHSQETTRMKKKEEKTKKKSVKVDRYKEYMEEKFELYFLGKVSSYKFGELDMVRSEIGSTPTNIVYNTSESAVDLVEEKKRESEDTSKSQLPMMGGMGMGGMGMGRWKKKRRDETLINADPKNYLEFKEKLRQIEKMKKRRYYKERGRPFGSTKIPKIAVPIRTFLLTKEIKKNIENVKDTTFNSQTGIDYDASRGAKYIARQAIRAVKQKNYKLLSEVFSDMSCHNPFMLATCDSNYETILSLAIENDDFKALKLILQYIDNFRGHHKRATIRSNLKKRGTGSYSKYTYGHGIRDVNISRGNREGNNAFTDDVDLYNGFSGSQGDQLLLQCILKAIGRSKISKKMMSFFITYPKTSSRIDVNYLYRAVASGNHEIGALLMEHFFKKKGLGFNKLHVASINKTEFEEKYRMNSVAKKSVDIYITPIHCAAINPHTPNLLQELCSYNVMNKNSVDHSQKKPIHFAAACEKSHNLEFLVHSGCDITEPIPGYSLDTPIHIAATYNRAENVKFILQVEPRVVNAKNNQGFTALHIACKYGFVDVVKEILECQFSNVNILTNETRETAAIIAAKQGNIEIIDLLKEKGADMKKADKNGKCILIHAIKNLRLELVKKLILEETINPYRCDSSENTTVHYACAYDAFDCLLVLQAAECSMNAFNNWKTSTLDVSMMKNNWCIFDYILESEDIDVNVPNENGETWIMQMLSKKDEFFKDQIIHIVKDKGARTDVEDNNGRSLFHLLCQIPNICDTELASFLKEFGAPLDNPDHTLRTPIFVAVVNSNKRMVQYLVQNGVNLNRRDKSGNTILNICIQQGKSDYLQFLLSKGAKLEYRRPKVYDKNKRLIIQNNTLHDVMKTVTIKQEYIRDGIVVQNNHYGWGNSGGNNSRNVKYVLDARLFDIFMFHVNQNKDDHVIRELAVEVGSSRRTPFEDFLLRYSSLGHEKLFVLLKRFTKRFFEVSGSTINSYTLESEHNSSFLSHYLKQKNEKYVNWMLELGSDCNHKNNQGVSPLQQAILSSAYEYEDFKKFCLPLLKSGGDIRSKDRLGRGILHWVFQAEKKQSHSGWGNYYGYGHQNQKKDEEEPIDVLSDLYAQFDFDVDDVDVFGRSPLHYSSCKGFNICSMFLIDRNAKIKRKDLDGNSPLALALLSGHTDYALHLINKGSLIKDTLLVISDKSKSNKDVYINLLDKGKDLKTEKGNEMSLFKYILQQKWKGLFYIVFNKGVDFHTAFQDALELGRMDVCYKLLSKTKREKVRSLDQKNGNNLMHILAEHGPNSKEGYALAKALVEEHHIEPDIKNRIGQTPLIKTVYRKNLRLLKFLLQRRCDLNTKDPSRSNQTPLIHIVKNRDFKMFQLIREKLGGEFIPDIKDDVGKAAIHYTVNVLPYGFEDDTMMFKILLRELGTNQIFLKDREGKTVLFYIYMFRSEKFLKEMNIRGVNQNPNMLAEIGPMISVDQRKMLREFYSSVQTLKFVQKPNVDKDYNEAKTKVFTEEKIDPKLDVPKPNPLAGLPTDAGIVHFVEVEGTKHIVYFDVMLTKTDINYGMYGKYMFYNLQVLHNTNNDCYYLLNNYGRVGEQGQYQMTPFQKPERAEVEFKKIFYAKTKNQFDECFLQRTKQFEHVVGKYALMERNKERLFQRKNLKGMKWKKMKIKCTLPLELQNLLKVSFDTKLLEYQIQQWGIDISRFSLGNISAEQLKKGESLLDEIQVILEELERDPLEFQPNEKETNEKYIKRKKLIDEKARLSSRFYELLPSGEFQLSMMTPIDSLDEVDQKKQILEKLLEVQEVLRIMIASRNQNKVHPFDYVFGTLQTQVSPLDRSSNEFSMVKNMMERTTSSRNFTIRTVFRVHGEDSKKYEQNLRMCGGRVDIIGEQKYLFHGTKVMNLLSILESGGLKIDPGKSVRRTGRIFGDGLYFADTFDKARNYCTSSSYSNHKVLLICEVALGRCLKTTRPQWVPVEFMNVHSIKGLGWKSPGRNGDVIHPCEHNLRFPHRLVSRKYAEINSEVIRSDTLFMNDKKAAEARMALMDLSDEKNRVKLSFEIEMYDPLESKRQKGAVVGGAFRRTGYGGSADKMMKKKKRVIKTVMEVSKNARWYQLKKNLEQVTRMKWYHQDFFCLGRKLYDREKVGDVIKLIIDNPVQVKCNEDFYMSLRPETAKRKSWIRLSHNEYIVFREDRIRIRYIVHFGDGKFDHEKDMLKYGEDEEEEDEEEIEGEDVF